MKTKWGSCNVDSRRVWLNPELAKKPPRRLEYIVVHELVHLLERHHNERFERAGQAWDVALQIAALREQAGLTQKELALRLNASQQQISRLESPDYEGHSLANLRRVAEALHARVRVVFEPDKKGGKRVAQPIASYRAKRTTAR